MFPATNSGKIESAYKCLWEWTDDHRPIWAYISRERERDIIQPLTMATKCKKSCTRAFTSLWGFIGELVPSLLIHWSLACAAVFFFRRTSGISTGFPVGKSATPLERSKKQSPKIAWPLWHHFDPFGTELHGFCFTHYPLVNWHYHGKSPCFIGKLTINGRFP